MDSQPERADRPSIDKRDNQPKIFEFANLSDGGAEVWIELSGITYRLRKTRQGKLILTK